MKTLKFVTFACGHVKHFPSGTSRAFRELAVREYAKMKCYECRAKESTPKEAGI